MRFNVEFSPMASPNFESGRPGEAAIELARLVERSLRETRAIDQEALCVLAGRKVGVKQPLGSAVLCQVESLALCACREGCATGRTAGDPISTE